MKTETVTVVRIYIREKEHLLDKLVKFLHDESEVAGLTVLRGVEGFAGGSEPHMAFLVDLSLDLPLVVEFYDEPEKAGSVIHSLRRRFPLHHIVSWTANTYR